MCMTARTVLSCPYFERLASSNCAVGISCMKRSILSAISRVSATSHVGAGVIAGLDHVNRGGDAGGGPSVVLVGPVRSRPSRLSCAWSSSSRPGVCLQLASIFQGFSRQARGGVVARRKPEREVPIGDGWKCADVLSTQKARLKELTRALASCRVFLFPTVVSALISLSQCLGDERLCLKSRRRLLSGGPFRGTSKRQDARLLPKAAP